MEEFFAKIPLWAWIVGAVWSGMLIFIVVCMRNAKLIPPSPEERERS